MFRFWGSWISAFLGFAGAIILVVLDKAGKLKNPTMLIVLLAIAAALTLPLALGNPWVYKAPSQILKFGRAMFGICLVGAIYSLLFIWIFTPNNEVVIAGKSGPVEEAKPSSTETEAPLALNSLDRRVSILEQLQAQTSTKKDELEKNYPSGYFLFAGDKHTIYIPSSQKAEKSTRVFTLDWEDSGIMYVDDSFVNILLKSFHYYPNEIQVKNLDVVLERKIGAIADGIYFNNIGMFVELIDDKEDNMIYVIGFKPVKLIPKIRNPKPEVAAFLKKLRKPIMSGIDTNIRKYVTIQDLAISSGWTTIEY
jgi:hypothetical protein